MTSWIRVTIAAALLLLAAPGRAFHTVFDFTIDRVEVDGNRYGQYDGTLDWVDDFDDPTLYGWYTPYGTSSVSGGRLHVRSPGEHYPGPDGTSLDFTEVASASSVAAALGSFTATAIFDPIIPPEGHFYHFTLFTYGAGQYFNELFGIDIHTIGGETRIEQHLVVLDLSHGMYQTVQVEGRTITAADLTGMVHFRVAYDAAAGTIASSYSLDGGATFASPFAGAPIFTEGRTSGQLILGADPHLSNGQAPTTTSSSTSSTSVTTTTSAGATTTTSTLPAGTCERTGCIQPLQNRLVVRQRSNGQSLAWTARNGPALSMAQLGDPTVGGGTRYTFCVRDGNGALVVHDEIAAGGSCNGRACWRAVGARGFAYRNGKDPNGLGSLKVTATGRTGSQVTVTAKGASIFGGGSPVYPLTLQVEADGGACWSATFATSTRARRGGRRPSPGY